MICRPVLLLALFLAGAFSGTSANAQRAQTAEDVNRMLVANASKLPAYYRKGPARWKVLETTDGSFMAYDEANIIPGPEGVRVTFYDAGNGFFDPMRLKVIQANCKAGYVEEVRFNGFGDPLYPPPRSFLAYLSKIACSSNVGTANTAEALIQQWDRYNDSCRGRNADCDKRDDADQALIKHGWCYGRPGQVQAEKRWAHCPIEYESKPGFVELSRKPRKWAQFITPANSVLLVDLSSTHQIGTSVTATIYDAKPDGTADFVFDCSGRFRQVLEADWTTIKEGSLGWALEIAVCPAK